MFPSAYNKKNDEESCTEVLHSNKDKEDCHCDLSQPNQFQPPRNDEDDLSRVIQDLRETVALIAKKQEKNEAKQKKTETRMEEQEALMSRKIENLEEHIEDDHQISPVSENPKAKGIDEDTFSIMMTSKVCSVGWVLGIGTFAFQMILIILILIDFQLSKGSTPFDAPIRVTIGVRIGQFFAVILSLLSQQDMLNAIDSLIAFRSSSPANDNTGFYRLLVDDNDDAPQRENGKECAIWFLRAILPNCLKLTQGISVLFVLLIVIIQSDDLIVLLTNFTALYFLSEIDNIFFKVASQGYFGENLKARTEKVKNVKHDVKVHNLEDMTSTTTPAGVVEHFKRHLNHFVLFALAAVMFSCLIYVAIGQTSGKFVEMKYPDCDFYGTSPLYIGDKTCDGFLNNADCGFDGHDCEEFNFNYPGCKASNPSTIGDGSCRNFDPYNSEACGYDGGDCVEFNAKYPDCTAEYAYWIGDGYCVNWAPYNSEACGYDGGDCVESNVNGYPGCTAEYPSGIGDGRCDNYDQQNSEACGFDGGDCDEFNAKYPGCTARGDIDFIGNGWCDNYAPYNTEACYFDGGDCDEFNAKYPDCTAGNEFSSSRIGDGHCDNYYNTSDCGYDGGDCL